jgi:hypothetical protein
MRISTLGQAAMTISTQRKSDPRRLSQLFRGELDWIVMKALEKDYRSERTMSIVSKLMNQCKKPTGWLGRFNLWTGADSSGSAQWPDGMGGSSC